MISDNLSHLSILPLENLPLKRDTFSCSSKALEDYFHRNVSQDLKRGLAKCFVLVDTLQSKIIGYYTLSSLSVSISDIPAQRIKKGIPYPIIPAALLGRLAIDDHFQKQGYGKFLVVDAMHRVKNAPIAAALLIVEAKDDNAALFYERLGFIEFKELKARYRTLFYPLTNMIK